MSQDPAPSAAVQPAWQFWLGGLCAILLAALFLVAGVWKLSDPLATEARMLQALVPAQLALAAALLAGVVECWAGVMVLVPRWRRWGAWLCALMLVVFMIYFAIFYSTLRGADCSCFPWLKRVVGPGFFISDGIMLLLAVGAAVWARRSESLRQAVLVLGAIVVFAGILYGVSATRHTGVRAPAQITVDGQPHSLQKGRIFVYFFDPQCMHCFAAAKQMATYGWNGAEVIAVTTATPQWGPGFLRDTGLKAGLSTDTAPMREVFKFTDPPYAVAIENGRQVQLFEIFDETEPRASLKKSGWIE
jgi:uncharacterized membrane protein YphA (DoxX/SURF4 family)